MCQLGLQPLWKSSNLVLIGSHLQPLATCFVEVASHRQRQEWLGPEGLACLLHVSLEEAVPHVRSLRFVLFRNTVLKHRPPTSVLWGQALLPPRAAQKLYPKSLTVKNACNELNTAQIKCQMETTHPSAQFCDSDTHRNLRSTLYHGETGTSGDSVS